MADEIESEIKRERLEEINQVLGDLEAKLLKSSIKQTISETTRLVAKHTSKRDKQLKIERQARRQRMNEFQEVFGKASQTIEISTGYEKEDEEWKVARREIINAAIERKKEDKIESLARRDALLVEKRSILANYHDEEGVQERNNNGDDHASLMSVCAKQLLQISGLESKILELEKGPVKSADVLDGPGKTLQSDLATARSNSESLRQRLGNAQAQIQVLEINNCKDANHISIMEVNRHVAMNKQREQLNALNSALAYIKTLEATMPGLISAGDRNSVKNISNNETPEAGEPVETENPDQRGEVTKLKATIDVMGPLFLVGIAARKGFLENTKRVWRGKRWVDIRGEADFEVIESRNIAVHQGNVLADLALFRTEFSTEDHRMHLQAVYGLTAARMNSISGRLTCAMMSKIIDMKGSMVACYAGHPKFSRNKTDGARFDKLYGDMWVKWETALLRREVDDATWDVFEGDENVKEMFEEMAKLVEKHLDMVRQSIAERRKKSN